MRTIPGRRHGTIRWGDIRDESAATAIQLRRTAGTDGWLLDSCRPEALTDARRPQPHPLGGQVTVTVTVSGGGITVSVKTSVVVTV